jgi:tetratricopeptide (TPR) repeat protein
MRRENWSAALVVVATLVFWVGEARGQSCPTAATPEEARALAGENFAAAQEAYEAGRPLRALNHYQCSYRLVPHHATLYNLGVLAQGIGEVAVALAAYREYLARFPSDVEATEIAERLAALEASIGAPAPEPEPEPVEPAPAPAPPPPPPPPPPPAPVEGSGQGWGAAPPPAEPPQTVPDEGRVSTGRIMAWVTLGLGVAAGTMGGVFMGLASNLNAEFHSEIAARQISLDELNAIGDRGYAYYVASWVMLGVGAALAVTSIVLFAAVPARTSTAAGASRGRVALVTPYIAGAEGFGLALAGRF